MKRMLLGLFALLVVGSCCRAQTTNSDGVSLYRNNLPADVLFTFPLSQQNNVLNVFIGCGESPMPNQIFVYEEQPDRSIKIYQFENVPVSCNQNYISGNFSLTSKVTVTTPDHTITVDSASWVVIRATGRSGYYWKASSGSATITVQ